MGGESGGLWQKVVGELWQSLKLCQSWGVANPYFHFKRFTVHQSGAAMKVSTEACLLGAWAPVENARRILDIGAGTGLLTLILAQRQPEAVLDAVEIDEAAARQAAENAAASPFADRIRVFHHAIQEFPQSAIAAPPSEFVYDLIVSNPPFYQRSLYASEAARSRALHASTLNFEDLLNAVERLLAPTGRFVVLLPPHETGQLLGKAAERGLLLRKQLHVFSRTGGRLFRQVSVLGRTVETVEHETLSIQDSEGNYSPEYVALLKEFYLKF